MVGDAPHQGLAGAVHHKGQVGKPGQGGVLPLGEGEDLKPPLFGGPNIVEDRLRLPALGDGDHQGGSDVGDHLPLFLLEDHEIVKVDLIKNHKAANSQPLDDVGGHQVGKAPAIGEDLLLPKAAQKAAKIGLHPIPVVVNKVPEADSGSAPLRGRHRLGEVVVQFAVALKAQPFAHFDDKGGGNVVFAGDLLDAHPPLSPLHVGDDTGDDFCFIFREEVGKQIVISFDRGSHSL